MDAGVGRMLDWLDAHGLRENTLVFFTSDNGMNMGHHGIWGKGNGTFPLNMYDTSVKVPAIISLPGPSRRQDVVCADLLSHYDCHAHAAGLPGAARTREADAAARAQLRPAAARRSGDAEREPSWSYRRIRPGAHDPHREWKYVHRYPYGPHEAGAQKMGPAFI